MIAVQYASAESAISAFFFHGLCVISPVTAPIRIVTNGQQTPIAKAIVVGRTLDEMK